MVMKWKKSILVGWTLRLQDKFDKTKIGKRTNKKPSNVFDIICGLIVGVFGVIHVLIIFLLAQFIEAPIRMLIFKGKLKDKVFYWFKCWRSAWRGVVG